MNYYFEINKELYVEEYSCDELKLCLISKTKIENSELKGHHSIWLKPETNSLNITIINRSLKGFVPDSTICSCK
jgi:hypothetical protein